MYKLKKMSTSQFEMSGRKRPLVNDKKLIKIIKSRLSLPKMPDIQASKYQIAQRFHKVQL